MKKFDKEVLKRNEFVIVIYIYIFLLKIIKALNLYINNGKE